MTTLSQQQLFDLYRNLPVGCVFTMNDVHAWLLGGRFPRSLPEYPSNYKTKLCKHYQRGYCRYGTSCNFAHGPHDLKSAIPSFVNNIDWCTSDQQLEKQDSPRRQDWKINPEPVELFSKRAQEILQKYNLSDPINLDTDTYNDWCCKVRDLVFDRTISIEDSALLDALCGRRSLPELSLEEINFLKEYDLEDPTNLTDVEYVNWCLRTQKILDADMSNDVWAMLESIADRRFCY